MMSSSVREPDPLLTLAQAAAVLGLSAFQVRNLDTVLAPHVTIDVAGKKWRRYSLASLRAYAATRSAR